MKKLLFLILVPAAAWFASGCATVTSVKAYPGAERSAAQLATVIVPASVEVRTVNGEKTPNVTSLLFAKEYDVIILPGAQAWSVRYSNPLAGGYYADPTSVVTESPWTELSFRAEAGRVYRLKVVTPNEDSKLRYEKIKVRFSIAAENAPDSNILLPARSPVVSTATPQTATPQSATPAEAPQTIESAALKQLQNWWQAAGPHERQAFRDWLKSQP